MTEPTPTRVEGLAVHRAPPAEREGARVLWLHGYTLDTSSWQELWERLPQWRHVGVDLPGHGASDPIAKGADLTELGRRLARIAEEVEADFLVGISIGCVAALALLLERGDRFRAVVLGAPSIAGGPYDEDVAASYRRLGMLRAMIGPGPAMTDAWLDSKPWEGLDSRPGLRERVTAVVGRHRWDEMRPGLFRQFALPPQPEAELARIAAPTRILVGEHDLPASRATAALLARALPAGELCELPGLHHLAVLEDPERAAARIAEHLRAPA